MKAKRLHHSKIPISDGSTIERPQGLKYRCNYSLSDDTALVRYDNEQGKGDHKHIGSTEQPYEFSTIDQMFADFFKDIETNGGLLE